jgi:conjugal transfer ATP-binding protein TraC
VFNTPPRSRAHELFTVLAYSEEKEIFYVDEGYLGFGFICTPLSGIDDKTQDRLNVLLNQDWPVNTVVQFILWTSPDIEASLSKSEAQIKDPGSLLGIMRKGTCEFLRANTQRSIDQDGGTMVKDIQLLVTVKLPIGGSIPSLEDQELAASLKKGIEQALSINGLNPLTLTSEDYVRIMHTILNWSPDASWRHSRDGLYDESEPLNTQLLDYETRIVVKKDRLLFGDKVAKSLSIKKMPDQGIMGLAHRYLIDPISGSRGIHENVLISASIIFPNNEKLRGRMEYKRQWATNQAYGPLMKFAPRIADKKDSYDVMLQAVDNGDRIVSMYLGLTLFADADKIDGAVANARTFWRENGFQLMEDRFICLPLFLNNIPFGPEPGSAQSLMRYRTMATSHAVIQLPIISSWKGGDAPVVNFIARDGQLVNFSHFHSSTNYNAIVAAESGSGKSFQVNELIVSYLAIGGMCWLIDEGRSYKKLCEHLEGQYLEFGPESRSCINPFDIIENYSQEKPILIAIIESMAAPTEKLSDFQSAGLSRVLDKVWQDNGRATSVDDIASCLLLEDDPRLKDLGSQLYPYTSKGEFGGYFVGKNNIKFHKNMVVVELGDLKTKRNLQKVVLLQMVFQIQQNVYQTSSDIPKIVIIDEGWKLLTLGDTSKFIEESYRQFRKHGGSITVVTQSLNDLYNSPGGVAMAENSAHKLLLGQTNESIMQLQKEGRLDLTGAWYDVLKNVRTVRGRYSETFFVSETGMGVGRLYVDDYKKLLFSTMHEEVYALEQLQEKGLDLNGAICTMLKQRGKEIPQYMELCDKYKDDEN